MATLLKTTGNVAQNSDFRYNTVYDEKDGTYTPSTTVKATGNGEKSYIYGDFKAHQFRKGDISENGIGGLFGESDVSRSGTSIGSTTATGSFSYNGGLSSEDNIPKYFTDEVASDEMNRASRVYTFDGKNVLSPRSDNSDESTDGVLNS